MAGSKIELFDLNNGADDDGWWTLIRKRNPDSTAKDGEREAPKGFRTRPAHTWVWITTESLSKGLRSDKVIFYDRDQIERHCLFKQELDYLWNDGPLPTFVLELTKPTQEIGIAVANLKRYVAAGCGDHFNTEWFLCENEKVAKFLAACEIGSGHLIPPEFYILVLKDEFLVVNQTSPATELRSTFSV